MTTHSIGAAALAIALLALPGAAAKADDATVQPAPATSTTPAAPDKAKPADQASQNQQKPAPIMLDPLTVTATKAPTPRNEVPATIDVIDQDR